MTKERISEMADHFTEMFCEELELTMWDFEDKNLYLTKEAKIVYDEFYDTINRFNFNQ